MNNSKWAIRLPIIITSAVAIGVLLGANFTTSDTPSGDMNKSLFKFREVLGYIDRNYVDDVDSEELVETAIVKMLEKLDPHTVYIPKEEAVLAQSQLQGNFEGIGIEFNIFKDTLYVVTPLSGGPSEKVGLQAGDKIVKVDGENIAGIGLNNRKVFEKLRGPKGSEAKLQIIRDSKKAPLDFTIIRDKIPQSSVDVSYMVNKEVGYIKVSRFTATTYDEFYAAMEKLIDQGMKKLVLDLTGNPGGYLDKAVNMADELLADDDMIVYTKGKETRYNDEYRAVRKGIFEKGPVVVMIDQGSASASEIVAGALQDNDRALIVGRRSFGKGLVQMPINLSDGAELRLTISRYYTPSGRSIQKPYDGKDAAYSHDLADRYENGELFVADSIHVNDTLEYATGKGRKVYGGGGIVPDFFVPIDTTETSSYLTKMYTSNSLREYTFKYYEANKQKFEKMGFDEFFNDFSVTDKMLEDLNKVAKENGVKYAAADFAKSKELVRIHMKAQIARSNWGEEGFFPVFNQADEIFIKALTLFDQAEQLAERN
ncbi:MAG: S41 family peptidase [Imperialibacter sp.]|uniref:S41 family peptidase n=1 Tax=Imperialibacter sp. TaxID=2038411 RepID=UPI003A88ED0A